VTPKSEKRTVEVEMVSSTMRLTSGRPMIVAVPNDCTDEEMLSFIATSLEFFATLKKQRPGSRIVRIGRRT
jgi:hypothetical protein